MTMQEMLFRAGRLMSTHVERMAAGRTSAPAPDLSRLPNLKLSVPVSDAGQLVAKAERIIDGNIDVLAIPDYCIGEVPNWNRDPKTSLVAPKSFGKAIDYRDETLVGNIKYLWEPSRHLMLPVLAQAYSATGDRRFFARMVALLDSWFDQCRYPYGPHWCSALEAGIRLVNWSIAWRVSGCLQGCRLAGASDGFLQRWLTSIYEHLNFIDSFYSGYSSANNHLIGEAAGVYVGATTWPAWPLAERLQRRSRRILIEQARLQTHSDGVNAEQAISYQQFVADFLLIAGVTGEEAGDSFPSAYWQILEDMLDFVCSIMDASGNVPMIGDADDGCVVALGSTSGDANYRSLLATGAILFQRPDFARKAKRVDDKTRWLIRDADARFDAVATAAHRPSTSRRAYPDGGYFILGTDFDGLREVRIVFDAGPLGLKPLAAHGHADALAFTLSAAGVPLLIDPGTYAYHTEPKWRNYFRGTSAHNTLRVDGCDQSAIAGNFMWYKHAKTRVHRVDLDKETQIVEASHDGYAKLHDPVAHRRTVAFDCRTRTLTIEDFVGCRSMHDIEIYFHFPEYADVVRESDAFRITARGHGLTLATDADLSSRVVSGDDALPLGWTSYRFDDKVPSPTLVASARISGPGTFRTTLTVL